MPIPSETRWLCERPFLRVVLDVEQTNGGMVSFRGRGGREARVTVGTGFVVFPESRGRWRNTLLGARGDETGIDVSSQKSKTRQKNSVQSIQV